MNVYWKNVRAVYVAARGKPGPPQVLRNLQGGSTAKLVYVNGQGLPIIDIVVQSWNQEQVIGPFTVGGSYLFFDPVHVGMN